jgi:hypothetical protein
MQYSFERLRFHFIEHAIGRVRHEGDAGVIDRLQKELDRGLTDEETLHLRERVELLYSETDKLLRSRIPRDLPSRRGGIELWGYQQIRTLSPDTYIHHQQPTRDDFDKAFVLPDGEVWAWNVVYTFTGPYYGSQTDADGQPATRSIDLGNLDTVLETAAILATFPDCEVLQDLTADNIDLFTLEADECDRIRRTLEEKRDPIIDALGERLSTAIDTWEVPLVAARNGGIAQFKRIHSIAYDGNEA